MFYKFTKTFSKVLLVYLCSINLFASPNTKTLSEDELQRQLQNEAVLRNEDISGLAGNDMNKKSKTTSSSTVNNDTYIDVATYNYLVSYMTGNNKIDYTVDTNKKPQANFLADNVDVYNKKMEQDKNKKSENKKDADLLGKTIFMSGYCYTDNVIEVEQVQGFSVLDCTFEENELGIDSSKMMAQFVPLTKRNALISKPIYLQKNNRKLPITNGVILTVDRTSMNVASFVNDKKLKKLGADLLSQSGDVILTNSTAYMEQKQASAKKEQLSSETSLSGTTVTKTTNTLEPEASTYLATAGIQFFSSIIKGIGLMMEEDKYPLFKVYQRTGLYVDFVIEIDEKNAKVVNYMTDSYEEYNKGIKFGEDVSKPALIMPKAN